MKVIIEGLHFADGEYEFEYEFTNRDLHEIKKISGVRAGEFEEAFEALDNDLVVAVAAIVLRKHGKRIPLDALWDAPLGAIRLDLSDAEEAEEEADAGPPSQTPSESESERKPSESADSSGLASNGSSDRPVSIPPATSEPTSPISSPLSATPQSSQS